MGQGVYQLEQSQDQEGQAELQQAENPEENIASIFRLVRLRRRAAGKASRSYLSVYQQIFPATSEIASSQPCTRHAGQAIAPRNTCTYCVQCGVTADQ